MFLVGMYHPQTTEVTHVCSLQVYFKLKIHQLKPVSSLDIQKYTLTIF